MKYRTWMPIRGLKVMVGTGVWGLGIAGDITRINGDDDDKHHHILCFKIYLLPVMVTGFYQITRWK